MEILTCTGDTMQEIKKVDVLSYAKISGALGAVIGFIIGLISALIGTAMMAAFSAASGAPAGMGLFVGAVAIIAVPIVMGISGFIGGAIVAFLYNVVAGWIGGVEIELV